MSHHNPKELEAFTYNYLMGRFLQTKFKEKMQQSICIKFEMTLSFKRARVSFKKVCVPCLFSKVNLVLGLPNPEQHTPPFIMCKVHLVYS